MNKACQYIGLMFLSACATAPEMHEQRFVNPLFYETLEPISSISWETHLTPNQRVMINRQGNKITEECILVKNTQESIALKCKQSVLTPFKTDVVNRRVSCTYIWDIYTYTIEQPITDGSVFYKGIRVIERNIESDGNESSRASFAIR